MAGVVDEREISSRPHWDAPSFFLAASIEESNVNVELHEADGASEVPALDLGLGRSTFL